MESLRTSLTAECAKEHIESHVAYLCDAARAVGFGSGSEWLRQFPGNPGVYCVFEDAVIIYAGETGSLKGRMRDLLETRHHTLRRQLGATKFGPHPSYQPATSKVRFPAEIEALLADFMLRHLKINAVPVGLGRKEIEERLLDLKSPRYNIKLRRGDVLDGHGL
jgi:GIY-YIG catalytic domain-containing protein